MGLMQVPQARDWIQSQPHPQPLLHPLLKKPLLCNSPESFSWDWKGVTFPWPQRQGCGEIW